MQCPVCDDKLREIERHGVMVDICPSCKGIWLDRGELEKILGMEERGDFGRGDDRQSDDHRREGRDERDRDDTRSHESWSGQKHQPTGKKRSLLTDLLEGFGGE